MNLRLPLWRGVLLGLGLAFCTALAAQPTTTPRLWNEQLLEAIRNDFARPTVHARNLYHLSVALHDAYVIAGGDPGAGQPVLMGRVINGDTLRLRHFPLPPAAERAAAQRAAMSYAAYRLLRYRFRNSPGRARTWSRIDSLMDASGYNSRFASTDYSTGNAAALGNAIGFAVIAYGNNDGANDANDYALQYYAPVNPPLTVNEFGNPDIIDVDRWQPLRLATFIDQSGNEIPGSEQGFLGAEWGDVVPFALDADALSVHERDGRAWRVYHDPGPPPRMSDPQTREFMMRNNELVVKWGALLDPDDGALIDISPGATGEYADPLPTREEYFEFYNEYEGGDNTGGLAVNPITGEPYAPNIVRRGDYYRVLAEFWADGPSSETPPGHWFAIMNYVLDRNEFDFRWRGQGPELPRELYELRAYVTLGGAVHDAAIAAWGVKGYYDAGRPVSVIRYMAERGQRSDPNLPRYHPEGLQLDPGHCEFITSITDPLAGAGGEHIGELKLWSWRGHDAIDDPTVNHAGVGWIRAKEWWPFQRRTFVSPPFAGYVSGHSTFSRAAAEVLTAITGSAYFPGGLGTFEARRGDFIPYEYGPVDTVRLTWATYRGASDEVSLSRIYGGIHAPYDDIPGRKMGIAVAEDALARAYSFFDAAAPTLVDASASDSQLRTDMAREAISVRLNFSEAIDTVGFTWAWPSDFPAEAVAVVRERWLDAQTLELSLESTGVPAGYEGVYLTFAGSDLYDNALVQSRTDALFDLQLVVGLQDVRATWALGLSPNPATDAVQLRTPGAATGAASVQLTDVAGRPVRVSRLSQLHGATLEVGDLPQGVYIVTVTAADGRRASARLVKS